MSDETEVSDVEEMNRLMELEKAERPAATATEPEPEPATTPEPTSEAEQHAPAPVTPTPAQETPSAADPLKWAEKKGLNSPEALARSLQSMEEEFHRRNQAGHPGYRDIPNGNPAPMPPAPPPNWNPNPQAPAYGYPPPPPPAFDKRELARRYDMDPDDFDKIARLNADLTRQAIAMERQRWEGEMSEVRRSTARNAEFTQLMQDPAFSDPRVQAEMREVLKDGQLFQQGGPVYARAFNMALANLTRKQLQQGAVPENRTPSNTPPVTAGGGNGSAKTYQVNQAMFDSWSLKDQEAFLKSDGRVLPKR